MLLVNEANNLRCCAFWLTMQNDRGRKKMLTNVNNLTFSPSLVDARLSITALALKSCIERSVFVIPKRLLCA